MLLLIRQHNILNLYRALHRGALSLLGYKCGFGQSRVCQSVVISPLESAFTSSILSP
ncbi:hypothetical protein RchiOBHm_Chr5g0083671 [Rosa chinensis]|uniref:Uncharacterized protein n=1 Tax=Rosa chinensis TaxID=74649 RepID=A0A2P6QNL9_ROSCH|nr:hypothetical protein RchiOBHm_Chr5g0083671 [Rosa chinensis]